MLKSIHLRDWKSFPGGDGVTVPLAPLTVLVGANGSGKSNLLDAIRFLQGIALDMSLAEIVGGRFEGGHSTWPGIRGGAMDVARRGAGGFAIESSWVLGELLLEHQLECRCPGSAVLLTKERLTKGAPPGEVVFETAPGPAETSVLRVRGRATDDDDTEASLPHADTNRGMLSQLMSYLGPTWGPSITAPMGELRDALKRVLLVNINPSRMRNLDQRQMTTLGDEGQNISAVLLRLCSDEEKKQGIVDWLAELCAPEVDKLTFVEVPELDGVLLELVERDGTVVSARSLSDGTLRFLGLLVALHTAPADSLVLIEEIENGLHPQRVHLLVEFLESVTKARGIQVIATTHSPRVLEALSPESLASAVVFARRVDKAGTVAQQLGKLPHFDEVLGRNGIEELFTTGWLELAIP